MGPDFFAFYCRKTPLKMAGKMPVSMKQYGLKHYLFVCQQLKHYGAFEGIRYELPCTKDELYYLTKEEWQTYISGLTGYFASPKIYLEEDLRKIFGYPSRYAAKWVQLLFFPYMLKESMGRKQEWTGIYIDGKEQYENYILYHLQQYIGKLYVVTKEPERFAKIEKEFLKTKGIPIEYPKDYKRLSNEEQTIVINQCGFCDKYFHFWPKNAVVYDLTGFAPLQYWKKFRPDMTILSLKSVASLGERIPYEILDVILQYRYQYERAFETDFELGAEIIEQEHLTLEIQGRLS